jgi:hypothetical protein
MMGVSLPESRAEWPLRLYRGYLRQDGDWVDELLYGSFVDELTR